MAAYGEAELVKLAKRDGNLKRTYLLVNPLQAKHVPVSPSKAWSMMASLADGLTVSPNKTTIIAFAETATAIGAILALTLSPEAFFIHSTRADAPEGERVIGFQESHSHASDHRIFANALIPRLSGARDVLFVDDEYSTGNTLLNIHSAIADSADCGSAKFHAVSVISRIEQQNLDRLASCGIAPRSKLRLPPGNYSEIAASMKGWTAQPAPPAAIEPRMLDLRGIVPDPRKGVVIGDYASAVQGVYLAVESLLSSIVPDGGSLAVIGTEECMFPSLAIGKNLESEGFDVVCHSSTRSPICVSDEPGYPLFNGFTFASPYDDARQSFIYDVAEYDAALIVSDSPLVSGRCDGLVSALAAGGTRELVWVMI